MSTFTPRQAITFTFIAFGVCVGSNVGALPLLKEQSSVTSFIFGFMAALGMLSNISMMALGGFINRHFDHRTVLLFVLPIVYFTMLYGMTVHSVWSFGLSIAGFNLALGALDLFMNAEGSVVEHDAGRPILSSFHAACLYAIAGFALVSSYVSVTYGPLLAALPALPFVAVAYYAIWKSIPHRAEAHEDDIPVKVVLPKKVLLLIGIVIGLDVACELSCIQWSGQLLADLKPDWAAYSGLGAAFYGFCNGSVRLVGDTLRARFGDIPMIIASFVVSVFGFAVLALAPSFLISVLAFAVVGVGLGMVFPCLFSIAARLVPEARAAALGFASGVSGLPRIGLPMILGGLAGVYGISAIFAAAGIAAVLAVGFTMWAGMEITKREKALVAQRLVG